VGSRNSDQIELLRFENRLRATADSQFCIDMVNVPFDSADSEDEFICNFGIGITLRDQMQHFELARAERFQQRSG
jgi:hypothetical protein